MNSMRPLFAALVGAALSASGASTLYVDVNNLYPSPPYDTWANAATNIQDAVDLANTGDTVLVTNGVYATGGHPVYGAVTNRVAVRNAVTIRSVNGPAQTVISGNQVPNQSSIGPSGAPSVRCAFLTNGATLTGFTLTNGGTWLMSQSNVDWSGAGIWCASNATVSNCVVIGSYAYGAGGGVCNGTYYNCLIASNSAFQGGGAANATLLNCALVGNKTISTSDGKGCGALQCVMTSCTLAGNRTGYQGGGVSFGTLTNCTLIGNSINFFGGGAYSATLYNCLVISNSSGSFGGGAMSSTLNNCSLVGNHVTTPGYSFGGARGCTLKNCIIYFNSTYYGPDDYDSQYSVLNYCCTKPLPTSGVGNITNAPLFIDLLGGNFRLQTGSPCINAGNNGYASGTTDLDGRPRIVGGTVDMGAYEFQSAGMGEFIGWLQQYGLATDGSADYVDSDADGMNNSEEWCCGTVPTNAASVLKMSFPTGDPTGVTVTWQSVAGKTYYVQQTTNLAAQPAFLSIQSNIVGQAGTTSYKDVSATNARPYFYRVGLQ